MSLLFGLFHPLGFFREDINDQFLNSDIQQKDVKSAVVMRKSAVINDFLWK